MSLDGDGSRSACRAEVLTGLLFLDESSADMHELSNSTEVPMAHIPYETLCPGSAVLDKLQEEYR